MEVFRLFKATREYLTPVLTESAFYERGLLTPEEFVQAGDHLVRTCPSWQWESGEKSKLRPYLPQDKQFLVTRGVPSYRRVTEMQASRLVEENVQGGMGSKNEEDWCAPKLVNVDISNDLDDELLIGDNDFNENIVNDSTIQKEIVVEKSTQIEKNVTAADEYADMEDESLGLDEAATSTGFVKNTENSGFSKQNNTNNIIRSRRYDVSITYDNYYRTPRIWLFGFDENGSPLSHNDVFEVELIFYIFALFVFDL
jgi:ubiquitin-like-conjugating enzyme ATG3